MYVNARTDVAAEWVVIDEKRVAMVDTVSVFVDKIFTKSNHEEIARLCPMPII